MTVLPEALRDFENELKLPGIRMVIYSLVLILLMLFRPQGIFGQRELSLRLLRRIVPGLREKGQL
jgi:branched-chain amino acid transport system permease protein